MTGQPAGPIIVGESLRAEFDGRRTPMRGPRALEIVTVVERRFTGDRHRIRQFASQQALDLIRRRLMGP